MTKSLSMFTAVRTEGGLLPPDLLRRISETDRDLPGLAPDDYHLAAGERLNEAINRSWNRLTGAWETLEDRLSQTAAGDATAQLTRRAWLLPLFQELGYGQLQAAHGLDVEGKHYPVSHLWGQSPIHLLGTSTPLDHRTPGVAGAAGMSPHGLVQELLNRSDDHLWGFLSNGLLLRVLRDNVSLTRQAYVEFDLQAIFDGQLYPDFALLWLLCHESRVEGEIPEKCLLEQWVQDAAQRGTRALEQLRAGVEQAITELGSGFLAHPANAALRKRLSAGVLDRQDYYRQLLRIVYRLIFLFVAEDRGLLLRPDVEPAVAARFHDYYGTQRLRRLALQVRGTEHSDVWSSLGVVFEALSSPEGQPDLGLPGLGSFLWSERATPDLEGLGIGNRHLLNAIRSLATVPDPRGRVTHLVDYRNLGSEELGSIYESLLELHPEIDTGAARFSLTTAGGNERRTTGSYYTPTSLINELLDSALDPVLEEAASADEPEDAILALTVLDPACGSGHFLVAAAHRIARRLAEVRTGDGEPTPPAIQAAMRDVVGRCIHGIDINPMAVELCKVSLWMEAMEPGKPLSFLEHRIVCGNALLGTTPRLLAEGIPDAAFKPLDGDDPAVVRDLKSRNKRERAGQQALLFGPSSAELAEQLGEDFRAMDALPAETLAEISLKERKWLDLQHSDALGRAQLAADAWCAAFVSPKTKGAVEITDAVVRQALYHSVGDLPRGAVDEVARLRDEFAFLHLHLAFPDIFEVPDDPDEADNPKAGWSGGFSVVLGNPPWERIKLQEKEWFASRSAEIAQAPTAAARSRLIAALETAEQGSFERDLSTAWHAALRFSACTSHLIRASQRFPLGGVGDVNTYAVFADLMRQVLAPTGRCGVICPTGLATGATYAPFFRDLLKTRALASFYSFENEDRVFPGVHNETKFALVTMTGPEAPVDQVRFTGYVRQADAIHDPSRRYELTVDQIEAINPNTLTAPLFRRSGDAEVTARIHAKSPVLIDERPGRESNAWSIDYLSMFHMANDSGVFRTYDEVVGAGGVQRGADLVSADGDVLRPLYEGKMFWNYDHRYGTYEGQTKAQANKGVLPHVGSEQHGDPTYLSRPRYWVDSNAVEEVVAGRSSARWLFAFRDLGPSERTLVVSVVPRTAIGHTAPVLLGPQDESAAFLCACLSSLVVDFALRQTTSSRISLFVLNQAPVLAPPERTSNLPWPGEMLLPFVVDRVLELSYTAWDLVGLAGSLGRPGPPYRWDARRRVVLQAELDALMFHLYGLDRRDTAWILDSFTVLKKYEERPLERGGLGEFRTKRLVLERYDAMAEAIQAAEEYQTTLDPPPAHPSLRHSESTRPDWAR